MPTALDVLAAAAEVEVCAAARPATARRRACEAYMIAKLGRFVIKVCG